MKLSNYFFILFFIFSSSSYSTTTIQEKIRELPQITQLEKITTGPYDHYQSTSIQNESMLFFTQKANLTPRILSLDLQTGLSHEFIEITSDSEQPALSPDGNYLAYVYYKNQARGEVCFREVKTSKNFCVPNNKHEVSYPFWLQNNQLAYVKKTSSNENEIRSFNIETKEDHLILKGPYTQAQALESFIALTQTNGKIHILDSSKNKIYHPQFDLPGFSSFPQFYKSQDQKIYIYWVQYLEDSNHDNTIDPKDNGVIFRVTLDEVLHSKIIFPEQLILSEKNCSYPQPTANFLYVTCANNASLDIFRLPLYGQIPENWSLQTLENAHQTARSYAERILILNNLRYRFGSLNENEFDYKNLMNSFYSDHVYSSLFYLSKLNNEFSQFENFLKFYFQIRQISQNQISNKRTFNEKQALLKVLSQIRQSHLSQLNKTLVETYAELALGNFQKSLILLQNTNWKSQTHALQSYILFNILDNLFNENSLYSQNKKLQTLTLNLINSNSLDDESKVFYTLFYIKNTPPSVLPDKLSNISQQIIKSYFIIQKMVYESDPNLKKKFFLELDQILNHEKYNYFLGRGIFALTAQMAIENDDFKTLEFISTNWLRYQVKSNTEFALARDILSYTLLERGYFVASEKKFSLATSLFYGAITLTDTLDSHYGYIRTMMDSGEGAKLEERYRFFSQKNIIGENSLYAKAILKLIQNTNLETLHESLEILSSMKESSTQSLWHLSRGYIQMLIYFEQLKTKKNDHDLYKQADRSFNLALDLAEGQPRIQASVLTNLALLHFTAQDFGLSTKYFEKRFELPFSHLQSKSDLQYFYAKSLLHLAQYKEAAALLNNDKGTLSDSLPMKDLKAYSLLYSSQFNEAQKLYEELLKQNPSKVNEFKYRLNLGFLHFKKNEVPKAAPYFERSFEILNSLPNLTPSSSLLENLTFSSLRLKIIILGFLAQTSLNPDLKLQYLNKRLARLKEAEKDLSQHYFKKENWTDEILKTHFQILAENLKSQSNPPQQEQIEEILKTIQDLSKDNSMQLSNSLFMSLVSLSTLNQNQKIQLSPQQTQDLKEMLNKTIMSYEDIEVPDEFLKQRGNKLKSFAS